MSRRELLKDIGIGAAAAVAVETLPARGVSLARPLPSISEAGLWREVLVQISGRFPAPIVDSWLRPCRLVAVSSDCFAIVGPSRFVEGWLREHQVYRLVQTTIRDILQREILVGAGEESAKWVLRERLDWLNGGPNVEELQARAVEAVAGLGRIACLRFAGVGPAKTKLLEAMGYQLGALFPDAYVFYPQHPWLNWELTIGIGERAGLDWEASPRFERYRWFFQGTMERTDWAVIAWVQPPDFEPQAVIYRTDAVVAPVYQYAPAEDLAATITARIRRNLSEFEDPQLPWDPTEVWWTAWRSLCQRWPESENISEPVPPDASLAWSAACALFEPPCRARSEANT